MRHTCSPLCVGGGSGSGVGSSRDSTERAMLLGLEWRELIGELDGSDITSKESPLTVHKLNKGRTLE